MIRVLIELKLVYPYKVSMDTLTEFCSLWDCTILKGGTHRLRASISMPSDHFKKIFGKNPQTGTYEVPTGTGHFITSWKVKKVITDD